MQVIALSCKLLIFCNRYVNIKASRRASALADFALAVEPQAGIIFNTGRDIDTDRTVCTDTPMTMAAPAGILDNSTVPFTAGTGLGSYHLSEKGMPDGLDSTASVAFGAGHRF